MYCQGKSSSCPFFLSFLPRPSSLASLEPPIYPPPPRVPRSLPLSGISFRFLSKAHPVSASYPSSFKSVGLPFKGIEISFGDIKPPLNRPLIQVGFGNFFFSVYPVLLSARTPRPSEADSPATFVCIRTQEWCERVETTPSSSCELISAFSLAREFEPLKPVIGLSSPFSFLHFSPLHDISFFLDDSYPRLIVSSSYVRRGVNA